jgi:predicted nucleotide-binding protein/nucleoside 2-deoxyribosyltransferase
VGVTQVRTMTVSTETGLMTRSSHPRNRTLKRKSVDYKPKVFIGSSTEALEVADTLSELLEHDAEPNVWTQDVFRPGGGTLQALMDLKDETDFAVLIMSADDRIQSRGNEDIGPRDNVLFEFGVFMSALGSSRTFMLYNRTSPPRIPSDLLGVTPLTYGSRHDNNLKAALGPAASQLKRRLREYDAMVPQRKPIVYWCGPHTNHARNDEAMAFLKRHGITVKMPSIIVPDEAGDREQSSKVIRSICKSALVQSDYVVVDLDTYGLDSAWEIGFADSIKKRVIGVSRNEWNTVNPRNVHNRVYSENFMHGWDMEESQPIVDSLEEAASLCEGKIVHVCGSFANEAAMEELRASPLAIAAKEMILPKDWLSFGGDFPKDYLWRAREEAVHLLNRSETALVVLPRYGMDTSWQIGYATAQHKRIIGWCTDEFGPQFTEAQIWDHWMHGWKQKVHLTNMNDLVAFLNGLQLPDRHYQ